MLGVKRERFENSIVSLSYQDNKLRWPAKAKTGQPSRVQSWGRQRKNIPINLLEAELTSLSK